jgi:hypothetical protein
VTTIDIPNYMYEIFGLMSGLVIISRLIIHFTELKVRGIK